MDFEDLTLIGLIMLIVAGIVQSIANHYLKKGYLPEKGKLKALAEEYPKMKVQLSENTTIVEGIRDKIATKTWASQQVWNAKKDAYDQIWINLLEMKEYTSERLAVDDQYYEVFINHCGYGGINLEGHSEEYLNSYYEDVEKDISHQKDKFHRKYNTTEYISERNDKKCQYIKNLKTSIKNIEINSIYLSPKVDQVSQFLSNLVKNQFKDTSYTWEVSGNGDVSESEWYQHIIFEYQKLLEAIESQMLEVKSLAREDLHLEVANSIESNDELNKV